MDSLIALCPRVEARFDGLKDRLAQLLIGWNDVSIDRSDLRIRQRNVHDTRASLQSQLLTTEPCKNVFDKYRETNVKREVRRVEIKRQHDPLRSFRRDNQRCLL